MWYGMNTDIGAGGSSETTFPTSYHLTTAPYSSMIQGQDNGQN